MLKNIKITLVVFPFQLQHLRAANIVMNFNEDEMTCIKVTIADNQELSQEIANCSEDPNPRTCIQELPELKKCFSPVNKASIIPLPVRWMGRYQI